MVHRSGAARPANGGTPFAHAPDMTHLRIHTLALLLVTALIAPATAGEPPSASVTDPSSVGDYVLVASANAPVLEAARGTADARSLAVSRSGRLPEPTVSAGLFVRSVETRVGPQEARVSVQQAVPWPSGLVASRSEARHGAEAAAARVEATHLDLQLRVRQAYWNLWEIRRTRNTRAEHLVLLDTLAKTTRSRLETGSASLAALQQIELAHARLSDALASLDERERAAEASLRATVGLAAGSQELQTSAERPVAEVPSIPDDQLLELALGHPRLSSIREQERAAVQGIRVARSSRAPALRAGLEWIMTGEATDRAMPDSGKDAWVAMAGIHIPLWQAGYARDVDAARATRQAREAEVRDAEFGQVDALNGAISSVRDSARRLLVVRQTLIPQAEAAYTSALGEYTVGEADVAQILLAQRDLLDLRVDLDSSAAAHAQSWAWLEATCGTDVPRVPTRGVIDGLE